MKHNIFQIQMEKLASRHAISELFNWISLMENVIEEDEENLKSAVGSNVIQDYLQKYKVEHCSKSNNFSQIKFKINDILTINLLPFFFLSLSTRASE